MYCVLQQIRNDNYPRIKKKVSTGGQNNFFNIFGNSSERAM
jgi:hypothetical protein